MEILGTLCIQTSNIPSSIGLKYQFYCFDICNNSRSILRIRTFFSNNYPKYAQIWFFLTLKPLMMTFSLIPQIMNSFWWHWLEKFQNVTFSDIFQIPKSPTSSWSRPPPLLHQRLYTKIFGYFRCIFHHFFAIFLLWISQNTPKLVRNFLWCNFFWMHFFQFFFLIFNLWYNTSKKRQQC